MDLLGVTEMSVERTWKVSAGEVKPGRCHRHPSLASPLRVLLFHITHDFYQYDLMFLKNFCTRHWVGPRKSASNRAPHLLRPALVISKTSLFHINDSDHYDLMAYQKLQRTPLSGAPQKCFQSGPALSKAGPGALIIHLKFTKWITLSH